MKTLFIRMSMCFLLFGSLLSAADTAPMVIKYPNIISLPAVPQAYKLELLKLLLEQTVAEYGSYRLEVPELNALGGKRQAVLLDEGAQVNLMWLPPSTIMAGIHAVPVPVDILQGLLGYRICLINSTRHTDFSPVVDVKSFARIGVGQGLGWADIDIYQSNNIQPVLASTFDGLMSMLAANRFQCLPLGANEINDTLHDYSARMPMLAIEPSLLVYYDYPIYFYVNSQYPLIAKRLALGFKKIQANGEFTKIFTRYHKGKLNNLNIAARRVICLKSPFLPVKAQCLASGPPGMDLIKTL